MKTESFFHVNLEFYILSDAQLFYKNYEGKEPKDVWTAFDIFKTNSIDMSKLNNIIFQKSKDFYILEKRCDATIRSVGLLFTGEDVQTNWVNRKVEDLNLKLPTIFEELEQFKMVIFLIISEHEQRSNKLRDSGFTFQPSYVFRKA